MLAQNVVRLESNEIYEQIQRFLKKKEYKSEGTRIAYTKDIKRFFEVVKQKEIHFLTREDVQITLDDFENFIEYLHDEMELNNKTINRNVVAVKGLLRYLYSKKLVDDIGYVEAKQIDRLPQLKNNYGVLAVSEVKQMAELASQERNKGDIKRLLILFCLDTCIRVKAVLNLKWTDFEETETGILVKAIDKGNKEYRPKIDVWFYEELLTLKKDGSEKVFNISLKGVDRMMKRLVQQMNIQTERRIVFHSVRKAGVTFQYRVTGDIIQAKNAANHSNVQTTLDYIEEETYGAIGAVSTLGKVDVSIINEVSHEDLLEAIGMLKKDTQLLISLKVQEILKNKH